MDVNLKSKDGREYLEVAVDPYPNPISYKGEFHYRSGSTKQVLRGAALSRFLLQKYGRTWDDVPLPGVGLKDLDGRVLQGFRQRGAESQRLPQDILEESDEGVIERLQLREAGFLKRAAVLLFHPRPDRFVMEAYVKIGCFRGSELLYQDVVEGDLFTQVDRTMDLLYSKYTRALISYDGVYRVETFPVPREAMREAVINAVIHRDYASPTTIQIRVYDDRIAVWNAVQLPPEWVADPLAGDLSSKPYNPRIAYAFFRAGTIEAWGRGIRRIVDMCREAGNPTPEWRVDSSGDGLWLRFPFSASYRAADSEAGTATTPRTTRAGVVGEVEAADQPESQPESAESQPESQPESAESQVESQVESRPESLRARALKLLPGGPLSKSELSAELGQKRVSGQLHEVVRQLLAEGMIEYTVPQKPGSRLQQYRLTDKGRTAVAALEPGSSRT